MADLPEPKCATCEVEGHARGMHEFCGIDAVCPCCVAKRESDEIYAYYERCRKERIDSGD